MFLRARPASETEVRIVGARAAALAKVSFDRPCGGTVPNFRIQVRRKGYRLSPRLTDESNNRRCLLELRVHVIAKRFYFVGQSTMRPMRRPRHAETKRDGGRHAGC